ncbi:Cu(I)-responsive transcriptional regulator [Monaibacterium marinum]|uniref:Cu(I)-responsive transcriptional regulator n=1 Tax=Pontivivens marinum TaxID=1690039 RepID=A0A2C9CXJ1_9RHOB|nr:Cu(I)-responsive transcriptional regulator [Monaibacterium marinum]SOH95159.1 Cu(I)-responsive transcriptional regulator [Monaibacterium marinum]
MNIGHAAKRTGLPTKTLRYYEEIGLVKPARDTNGYRAFSEVDIHNLTFVARSRALGFSVEECRTLLTLWQDTDRASADVRKMAALHLARIEEKIADLAAMRDTLSELVQGCAGDDRPDCPILNGLAGE